MNKLQRGQGLFEYVVLLLIVALVILMIALLFWTLTAAPPAVCDRSRPTAGDIVSCIATRTAEARNR